MIGELLGGVAGWVAGEIVNELFGGIVDWLWPKRVSGFAVIVTWLVVGALAWWAARWWQADPASDRRTQVVALAWVFLPLIAIMLTLTRDAAAQERRRLRRESVGLGALPSEPLRVK